MIINHTSKAGQRVIDTIKTTIRKGYCLAGHRGNDIRFYTYRDFKVTIGTNGTALYNLTRGTKDRNDFQWCAMVYHNTGNIII